MKAKLYDKIQTLVEVQADFSDQIISNNTLGTVVECYDNPEGYAVDLALPCQKLVGGFEYVNVILSPDQFALIEAALQPVNCVTNQNAK